MTAARWLLTLYIILFILLALQPYSRDVWFAENLPVVIVVMGISLIQARIHQFSTLSLLMMSVFITLHTIGGHYTFERVPFGFITDTFGFERNHFDRLAHFSVGFYAFAIAELVWQKGWTNNRIILCLFSVFSILSVAAGYEIVEWLYAISADADAGIAVLGSQGDIWDAQKDMTADGLGAIFATLLFLSLAGQTDRKSAE